MTAAWACRLDEALEGVLIGVLSGVFGVGLDMGLVEAGFDFSVNAKIVLRLSKNTQARDFSLG
jgi:hypothetical protein